MKIVSLVLLLLVTTFLSSCSCSGGKNRTDSQWVNDMAKQSNIKAQEGTDKGDMLMKEPPKGSIARNRRYYPYPRDPLTASKKLKNSLLPTVEILKKGKVYYQRYCIYCHGTTGDTVQGASVAPKMIIKPASLLTDKAKNYTDGRIYHIIHEGQGLMGAYRIQLGTTEQVLLSHYSKDSLNEYKSSKSIWSVVYYIRSLQKKHSQLTNQNGIQKTKEDKK